MKIITHTKYGIFQGIDRAYDKTEYEDIIGKFPV